MEVVDVTYIGSDNQYQTYTPADVSLINTVTITGTYGASNDYIEYFIKDLAGTVLSSNYYTTQYSLQNSVVNSTTGTTTQLYLDPETDAKSAGYNRGVVNLKYNFFAKQLLSAPNPAQNFWIKEISTSRTEIKVARQDLSNTQLANSFAEFNAILSADAYYPTFYLNFGADIQIIGVNAVYVEEGGVGYIIFKLYEPLPTQFDIKSTFWVVTQVADSAEFNVSINVTPEAVLDTIQARGPNFKVSIEDKVSQTTPYFSYASLFATTVTSSYQQLQSIMQEKGIQINVDYSDFNNFVHFSSATERLYNFSYKVGLIESASAGLAATNTSTAKVLLQNQIDSTIANFDGYEYYLYFSSASTAWPKSTLLQPYTLYSVTSSQVQNWLGSINTTPTATTMSMYWSSSRYDDQNKDLLLYATPGYITEDSANEPYLVFLNMIGQHFDNIWIYLKDVTNHYSAENNPFVGISLDQVADALRSFGVQLYTNTSITDNIYYSMLGINQTGSNLPVTSSQYAKIVYASSSLTPSGSNQWLSSSLYLPPFGDEKINKYVITFTTASGAVTSSFNTLPNSQITGEIYKRLYHNLAYLLKTRGTERGVKALVTTYGIPNDILTPHEYGGYDYLTVPGIQEISNTRILTGSVLQISSSLLSPFTTIQYFQNNIEKTSGNVEVAFTLTDSINAAITSSQYVTSSAQPGYFNIMQLIGDPTLQYSSSYTPLDQVSNTFFTNTFPNRNNVWDFIRIIKYYNNSLFKMLKDWVPARTSPSTAIVVKSHMLERNKYPRHEPTYTIASGSTEIKMVNISGSDGGAVTGSTAYLAAIPVQYNGTSSAALANSPGTIYMSSSNDIQKYNGEFSGSTIQASYNYFSQEYVSSYNYPWTSSTPGNNGLFLTYSLSPLFENINTPVRSQRFLDLDYNSSQLAPVNYGLVTESLSQSLVIGNVLQSQQPYSQYAYIQDYNYNSRPYTIPRYSGSYLSGRFYNTHSFDDTSYGTDPVINWYSDKLGLFTQIATSSFLPGKVNATLAYLADVSGGLFELNQNNRHWIDVQNTFKANTTLTVKQFDNKKFSNQKSTDGAKNIYNSGYSYTPELYYRSGSDTKVWFQYQGTSSLNSGFTAINGGSPNYYISGAASPHYPGKTGFVYNMFDSITTGGTGYTPGVANTSFPTYTPTAAGQLSFNANFSINVGFTVPNQSITYSFNILNGLNNIGTQTQTFTSVQNAGTHGTMQVTPSTDYYFELVEQGDYINNTTVDMFQVTTACLYPDPFGSITVPNVPLIQQPQLGRYNVWQTPSKVSYIGYFEAIYRDPNGYFGFNTAADSVYICSYIGGTGPVNQLTTTLPFDIQTAPNTFTSANTITFQLTQSVSTNIFTASLTPGSLTATVTSVGQGGYPFATSSADFATDTGWFISSIFNNTGTESTIVFDTEISTFYQYQQVPLFVSASTIYSSSLYEFYGDINSLFDPQFGDKIVIRDYSGITQDVDILNTNMSSSGQLCVTVVPQLLGNWVQNPGQILDFLMLRRYNDEQNVILSFIKTPGQTSYGFVIPDTTNPNVLSNINTLQAAVQSQLLSNQSIPPIDTINGGTFGV
jgi:hypothetical protein